MNLRQLDKKHYGRQGEPKDVIVGNSARNKKGIKKGRE